MPVLRSPSPRLRRSTPPEDRDARAARAPAFAEGVVTLGSTDHEVVCLDLSETGAALRFERLPAVGQIARFDLSIDPETRLRGTGEIVRGGGRRRDEAGLRFIALHRASLDALRAYVAARGSAVVRFPTRRGR